MSTPCRIILKVNKEDLGRKIKFDPNKLPIPYCEWVNTDDKTGEIWLDQRGKCCCQEVTLNDEYISVYCHWDGSTESTGNVLKRKFKTYESVLNLIVGGFMSGIACGHVKHYANRKGTVWNLIKPVQGSLDYVRTYVYGRYEHIFENGKWKCRKEK